MSEVTSFTTSVGTFPVFSFALVVDRLCAAPLESAHHDGDRVPRERCPNSIRKRTSHGEIRLLVAGYRFTQGLIGTFKFAPYETVSWHGFQCREIFNK